MYCPPQTQFATSPASTGTQPSQYLYSQNNMFYNPQPSMQQFAPPQHFAALPQNQGHAQPAPAHPPHWTTNDIEDFGGVNQQPPGNQQQQRRPQPPGAPGFAGYRPAGQVQADGSPAPSMGMARPGMMQSGLPQDLPLRMVVEAKYVGAIIGQGGSNIREISRDCKARCVVDVQRAVRDPDGSIEKVISIIGQPENCTKACIKILDVVQREREKDEPEVANGGVMLKLRAHNQLVGRLIGKQGMTIKKIMQDTNSVVFVSKFCNSSDPANAMSSSMPPMYDVVNMERTITIKAPTVSDVSNAEQRISQRLRQSFEMDIANRLQSIPPGYPILPGMPSVINPIGDAYAMSGMNFRNSPHLVAKTVRMYVPNNMVGAIIGTKGANIRNIMRNSGANIKIEGGEQQRREDMTEEQRLRQKEIEREERERNPEEERMVTIIGNDGQQYRAQFWIYHRVAEQTSHPLEEIKLRTEIQVPSKLVGRIIGKGGQNVRELQRITGAQVKIPDESEEGGGDVIPIQRRDPSSLPDDHLSTVRIIGTMQSSQSVQMRIAHVCSEFHRMLANDRRYNPREQKPESPSSGEPNQDEQHQHSSSRTVSPEAQPESEEH